MTEIKPSEANKGIYNPVHEDRLIKLANDIKRNGLLEPLIVSTDGVIISGHTRYKALDLLGRSFVKIRRADIHSTNPDFIKVLTSANNQRVKTEKELLNEIAVNVDPAGYAKRSAEYKVFGDVDLKQVAGELKSSRKLTDNYDDLQAAIIKILEEHWEYLPMSLRAIHYQLLNNPPIESRKTGNRYQNERKSYAILSKVVVNMRVNGIIPHTYLRDDKRKIITNRGYLDSTYYLKSQLDRFLTTYSRDLMQSQENYISIICEKETLAPQVDRVANKYGVPVIYAQGNSSITIRHRLIEDWSMNGEKPIVLLVLSDLDPAGYRIQDSFVGSIKSDFAEFIGNTPVMAYRVGITKEQVSKYGLHSDMDAKETDKGFKKFVRATGMTKAYELDALPPAVLMQEIEEAIKKVIDIDLYNSEQEAFNQEVNDLERKRQRVLSLL